MDVQPSVPAASITAEAVSLGRDAGKAAASWMSGGNTPGDAYRAVQCGTGDGDPAIPGGHPVPGLSADVGYSKAGLARDLGLNGEVQLPPDAVTAYLDAAAATFSKETERIAREPARDRRRAHGAGTEPGR